MAILNLSLIDYAADPNLLVAGVAKVLRDNSKIMDILPFADVGTLSVKTYREAGMAASTAWRQIGAAHGSVKSPTPKEIEEMAYSIGNEIQIDKVYMKDKSPRLVNPFTFQTQMITKGIARNFSDKFMNGLPTDLNNPVGIWWRIMNDLPSTQRVTADPAGASAGLDISSDASGLAANIQMFIDKLDYLLYMVTDQVTAEGAGVYFLMNDTLLLRIQSMFRQSNILDVTKDAMGRVFPSYKGAMLVDVGWKDDETDLLPGTRIIGNLETKDGTSLSSSTATSVYGIKVDREHLTGWQEYALNVSDPTLDPVHQVSYTSVIDWVVGICITHPRSAARLYGIQAT